MAVWMSPLRVTGIPSMLKTLLTFRCVVIAHSVWFELGTQLNKEGKATDVISLTNVALIQEIARKFESS